MTDSVSYLTGKNRVGSLRSYLEGNPHCLDDIKRINTPMHDAARIGNDEMIVVLFKTNNNLLYAINAELHTPLCVAVMNRHVSTVKLLLKLGCTTTMTIHREQNSKHPTPFHIAVSKGFNELVELLFNFDKPSLDFEDHMGFTPLHHAVKNNHLSTMVLLARLGSTGIASRYGDLLHSMHMAITRDNIPAAALLLKLGTPIDMCHATRLHRAPLIFAVHNQKPEMVTFFHERGSYMIEKYPFEIMNFALSESSMIILLVRLGIQITDSMLVNRSIDYHCKKQRALATLITLFPSFMRLVKEQENLRPSLEKVIEYLNDEDFCLEQRHAAYFQESLVTRLLRENGRLSQKHHHQRRRIKISR